MRARDCLNEFMKSCWGISDVKGRSTTGRALSRCVAVALVFLAAACSSHGKDFQRPDPAALVLGQTTKADVIARLGPPEKRTAGDINGVVADKDKRPAGFRSATVEGDIERLSYSYTKAGAGGGGLVGYGRHLFVGFWNDKLVYYLFTSSFKEDTSAFNEARASSFVRGKTTRDEVIAALGRPGGEGIYPAVAKPGTRMISYLYTYLAVGSGTTLIIKHLDLLFDASDRLLETYLFTQGAPVK